MGARVGIHVGQVEEVLRCPQSPKSKWKLSCDPAHFRMAGAAGGELENKRHRSPAPKRRDSRGPPRASSRPGRRLGPLGIPRRRTAGSRPGSCGRCAAPPRRARRRHQRAPARTAIAGVALGIGANSDHERRRHTVKRMAPQAVKPYVQGNRTNGRDAEGICEAASRPRVRPVAIKSAADTICRRCIASGTLCQNAHGAGQPATGGSGEYGLWCPRALARAQGDPL